MKVVRQSETELVLEDSSLTLAALMVAAAAFLIYAGLSAGKKSTLIPAALFLLFAFLSLHKTTIVFDSLRRMASWQRLRYLSTSSGTIAYDDIKDVVIQTTTGGTSGRPTYRLAMVTPQGSWPMSDSYGGNGNRYTSLCNEVWQFLNLTPLANPATASSATDSADLDRSIRALLAQGQKIEAIKLLRSAKFIGLKEAKERVDQIDEQMRGR